VGYNLAKKNTGTKRTDSVEHTIEDLIKITVETASDIHKKLGSGQPVEGYGSSMESGLKKNGCTVKKQIRESILADGDDAIECSIVEMLVNGRLALNIVAADRLLPAHKRQLLSQLELEGYKLGLLINFNEANIDDGIIRVIN